MHSCLKEGRQSGGRGDNVASLLHMFENLHSLQQVPRNDRNSPEYPRHHGFLQRRGTDEGSLLSSRLRKGSKEEGSTSMNLPRRVQSQEAQINSGKDLSNEELCSSIFCELLKSPVLFLDPTFIYLHYISLRFKSTVP